MIAAGTRRTSGAPPRRVLTAVLVLYALVLQAVLGGAVALPGASPLDVTCLKQVDEGAAPVHPAGHADHHPGCCTLAPAPGALAPSSDATPVAWPQRVVTPVAWRMAGVAAARAPPGSIAHPRGPPVV